MGWRSNVHPPQPQGTSQSVFVHWRLPLFWPQHPSLEAAHSAEVTAETKVTP